MIAPRPRPCCHPHPRLRPALILAAAAVAAVSPATAAASHHVRPAVRAALPASAELTSASLERCRDALRPAARSATFAGEMAARAGTRRMAMRFDLLASTLHGRVFRRLMVPGLGRWERSKPGVALFVFHKVVANLPVSGAYRAEVNFRWYDARGRVMRQTHHRTGVCQLADVRPNLVAGALRRRATARPGTDRYELVVANTGLTDAPGPVDVVLSVGGAVQPPRTIGVLRAGARQTLTLEAPACPPGATVSFTVDPARRIDEITRSDNTRTERCRPRSG